MNPYRAEADTLLKGKSMWLARGIWLILASFTIITVILSLPAIYARYQVYPASYLLSYWSIDEFHARLALIGLSPQVYANYNLASTIFRALFPWILGGFLFIRKSDDRSGIYMSLVLVMSSLVPLIPGGRSGVEPYFGPLGKILVALAQTLIFSTAYLFPDIRFVPRWTVIMPVFWLSATISYAFLPVNLPAGTTGISNWAIFALLAFLLGTGVFSTFNRYHNVATPVQRQQSRWIYFSFLIILFDQILIFLPVWLFDVYNLPGVWGILYHLVVDLFLSDLLVVLFLVGLTISVLYHHLFDIDIIIRRSLLYGLLTVVLGGFYFGGILFLGSLLRSYTKGSNQLAIVLSTLIIASLANPLYKLFQSGIDRRFYRRKFDAEKALESFAADVRDEVDLNQLTSHLGKIIQDNLQPTNLTIWLNKVSRAKTPLDEAWRMLLELDLESEDELVGL